MRKISIWIHIALGTLFISIAMGTMMPIWISVLFVFGLLLLLRAVSLYAVYEVIGPPDKVFASRLEDKLKENIDKHERIQPGVDAHEILDELER